MRHLILLGLLVQSMATVLPPKSIPPLDAPNFVGSKKIVCGDVRGIRPGTEKEPTRIDLGRAFPDQPVTLLVSNSDFQENSSFFDRALRLPFMCVEGKIERVNGVVAVKFRTPSQSKYVGPPARNPRFPSDVPRCGLTGVGLPKITQQVNPRYNADAMRAKMIGEVDIDVVVQLNGSVGEMQIIKSVDPWFGLDDEALDAASQWKFRPALSNGLPVACIATLVFTFGLH